MYDAPASPRWCSVVSTLKGGPPADRVGATKPGPAGEVAELDAALHDLTNALAAARSFAEVLVLRLRKREAPAATPLTEPRGSEPGAVTDALLMELDRANSILQKLRQETFRRGDVLRCRSCNYSFVFRKKFGRTDTCRRCRSTDVERWKPGN